MSRRDEDMWNDGVRIERARIVADLRKQADESEAAMMRAADVEGVSQQARTVARVNAKHLAQMVRILASRYERGEHVPSLQGSKGSEAR